MKVISVSEYGVNLDFEHADNQLTIHTSKAKKGLNGEYIIHYQGIPKDGLVIGKNKYGERTFFGDNWPNRAENWIACVDHPSDKAKVNFSVIAPNHYSIVANGQLTSEAAYDSTHNLTIYQSNVEIPMKVMVFGAADFAEKEIMTQNDFHVESWVYKKDAANSFKDLEVAKDPLNFFITKIGAYPFSKLANVQSTTRFGGMENAGCIFYDEEAFSGKGEMENLIAHEIAHQWFGNSVTETDWKHLWLSEGFATYLTNLHIEQKYGRAAMNEHLKQERERVIAFENMVKRPVIDTITKDVMKLLNPNSYQKGSWTLHMLRNKIGEDVFWNGLSTFYKKYKYSNASSNDFISVMEDVSQQDLTVFFNQWLKRSEMPHLSVKVKKKCKGRIITIEQKQELLYSFPLEVEIVEDGVAKIITVQFTEKTKSIEFKAKKKGTIEINLDPNCNLLFSKS